MRIYRRPVLAWAVIIAMFVMVATAIVPMAMYRLLERALFFALEFADPDDEVDRTGELDTFPEYAYFGLWRRRV